jgi:hypothetical protein
MTLQFLHGRHSAFVQNFIFDIWAQVKKCFYCQVLTQTVRGGSHLEVRFLGQVDFNTPLIETSNYSSEPPFRGRQVPLA